MARRPEHDWPILTALRCEDCGHYLARTESGFLACPLGHGRLIRETDDDPQPDDDRDRRGGWFDEDLPPAA
jgi:hypothetical protein